MRKVLALILFLILVSTSQAQEKVYLPLIMRYVKQDLKNNWTIVKPISTTNNVLNPSAETTGNYAATGSATITRSTTYAKYGLYSYRIQTSATNTGLSLTLGTLTNSEHWMTARIRGTLPKELRFSIGPSSKKPVLLERIDDYWALYGVLFLARESNGATSAHISQLGAGSGDFYIDGVQVEPLGDWTTYVDGTQEGCEWNGAEHASTSSRSGEYIGGGTPQDLYQTYKFFVTKTIGAGATTSTLGIDSYAILPGGELNSIKTESRQFTLIGKFITDTERELHDARQDLIKTLRLGTPGQPLKLRFNGGRVQKEIGVYYQGGLEGDLAEFYEGLEPLEDNQWGEVQSYVEKASIQFLAPDPYWYEVGESAASLNNASDTGLYSQDDTNESATFRYVAARLRSTGQWDELGPPGAGGTYFDVRAIAEDNVYIYIGGNFLNWDGIANADHIVRYNKQTGVYSAMGTGMSGRVNTLTIGPDGQVYAGGQFALAGGVANTVGIARWNGTAWFALSTGMSTASVSALLFGPDGLLYIGGGFVAAGGIPDTARITKWDGTTFIAMSTGADNQVETLAFGLDGTLYLGGSFNTIGGVSASSIASWNGSSFSALGSGVDLSVYGLTVNSSGLLYLVGDFTTAGGNSALRAASWNGSAFSPLGSGLNGTAWRADVGADNMLYVSGFFTSAGGITLADRVARWNGYSWSHLDIDLPGLPNVYSVVSSKYVDPVIKQKYNLYLGFDTTGVGVFDGKTVVNNEGNVSAFPKAVYFRSGGNSAIIETLRNERTGKELLYDYRLLNGETLITDLTPTNKSITSSFFGPRSDAVLSNSDFGTWQLLPGNNDVTTFVPVSGGPQLTAYLLWRDTFDSWD